MTALPKLTAERLRELLHYDPETGIWTWLVSPRANVQAGMRAGSVRKLGYTSIKIDRRLYLAHRLAFLYMTGEWPICQVDHKDRDPNNDCWLNLRAATRSQNIANSRRPVTNTTGFKGVTRERNGFRARIIINGKEHYLGIFVTREDAAAAYAVAAVAQFGEFARPE